MLPRIHQFILIVSLVFVPAIALAQEERPRANRNSDFTTEVPANLLYVNCVVVDSGIDNSGNRY